MQVYRCLSREENFHYSMDLISCAVLALKFGAHVVWRIQRKEMLKKLKEGESIEDGSFLQRFLNETDALELKLDQISRKELGASRVSYKEGLTIVNEVLSKVGKIGEDETPAATMTASGKSTFYAMNTVVDIVGSMTGNLKSLKVTDLDEKAGKLVNAAKEAFGNASREAKEAFSNPSLKATLRVQAMSICIMAKILKHMDDPSIALPSCKSYLNELYSLQQIQDSFCSLVTGKGSFDKEIVRDVCYLNRLFFDVIHRVSEMEVFWSWPPIIIRKDNKIIYRLDPLRDVRVTKVLCSKSSKKDVLSNVTEVTVAWSFGAEEPDTKLISPQDVTTDHHGHFIVADNGDRCIKVFNNSGKFVKSFSPLPRHQVDEEICSVVTDREDNIFVVTKIDKYHHKVDLFDKDGKLLKRFPLEEGLVRCSPVINDSNELFVVIENQKNDSKHSTVYAYRSDGKSINHKGFGQDILMEPTDMTIASGGLLMVLNRDGHVVTFDKDGKHLPERDFYHKGDSPANALAFHSESEHVVISSLEPGFFVNISIYDKRRACVHNIYQGGEQMTKKEQRECVPPKIVLTKDGNIAVLAGSVGECKVVVL